MAEYKCEVCGYVYDPRFGIPNSGIKLGTPFEELPNDWVCHICRASKSQFRRLE